MEAVSKGDSIIRDLKMESDKCSTTLDIESIPTTYVEDDHIAKAGKVQHDDGKVMPENVREGELGACDSQCTNMILDNGCFVKDDSSTQVEATKLCIEGDNSSSESIMRVKEFDHMEELTHGSLLKYRLQQNSKKRMQIQMPPDVTSVKSRDYFMRSAPTSNGKFATRNVVYKLIAYQRIELGNSLELFDNHMVSYMVIRTHLITRVSKAISWTELAKSIIHLMHFNSQLNKTKNIRDRSNVAGRNLGPDKERTFRDQLRSPILARIGKIAILASESSVRDTVAIINSIKGLILAGYVVRGKLKGQGWKAPNC
ncbi:LOW QUALITY PROTEIN: hypothetical protein Cgig2_006033 [Carnegiea gigantea]|uniref:Uncharacterized protein n=1 Tax=Carnegiea gigantea TaxID=171969 RepID=A0A9Q1KZ52_9CARY|nr:LOW QUALITY PROTEIN: hypothetical protein Cgig2_006033 [Carnegiea gigantea]